ncbi:hypothetical protein NC651_001039 [Populus alba x Populus x berolinensis]|nr:hypothetical protein NC651_001039 [Populus alba x Populus x berolinensis]
MVPVRGFIHVYFSLCSVVLFTSFSNLPLKCLYTGGGILAAANIIISTFLLVFVAEWSDKSFFSTIGRLNLDYIIFVYRLNSQVPVYIVNGSLSACLPVILQEFSHAALAATSSPLGVIGGSLTGHGVATVIDVVGGSLLGKFLSEMEGLKFQLSFIIKQKISLQNIFSLSLLHGITECPTQCTLILSLQQWQSRI